MAGKKKNKKTGRHAKRNQNVQMPNHTAAPAGRAATFMEQQDAQQQGGQCTATTGAARHIYPGRSATLAGMDGALQEYVESPADDKQQQEQLLGQLVAHLAAAHPQPHGLSPVHTRKLAKEAPADVVDASKLVAQLKNSNEVPQQVVLLQDVSSAAQDSTEFRSQLLTGGVLSVLLRLLQSSSKAVQGAVRVVIRQLVLSSSESEAALMTSVIPQLVPLLRSRNQDTQSLALHMLGHLSDVSKELAQSIAAAGAIPAVTDALHKGRTVYRLCAAFLLLQLSGAGGMGIDTALAGAVPVFVSLLQCGTPDHQLDAARILRGCASQYRQAAALAVSLDVIPALLPMLSSAVPSQQQVAADLLSKLVGESKAAQTAYEEGAVPVIVQLLCDANQGTRFCAAQALKHISGRCSKAASTAAAAGAIPPLVKMLATSSCISCPAGCSNDSGEALESNHCELFCGRIVCATDREWQIAALCCLHDIAIAGGTQCRAAMKSAGAVPAVCAAAHSQEAGIQELAVHVFKFLLVEGIDWSEIAAPLLALLSGSTDLQIQENVQNTISCLLHADTRIKSALVAAGMVPGFVAVMQTPPIPMATVTAMHGLMAFVRGHAAAVVEAGAVPLVAQQVQGTSADQLPLKAALVLCALASYRKLHDQLAGVVPQLLQAMWNDDEEVQLYVGQVLQLLAARGNASVLQAFRAATHQWHSLLGTHCSEAQRNAAGAIKVSILRCDSNLSRAEVMEASKDVYWIDGDTPSSEWTGWRVYSTSYAPRIRLHARVGLRIRRANSKCQRGQRQSKSAYTAIITLQPV